jgi:hypothetical protein
MIGLSTTYDTLAPATCTAASTKFLEPACGHIMEDSRIPNWEHYDVYWGLVRGKLKTEHRI